MTLLVTRPRRSLSMYPAMGLPVTGGAPVDIEETADAFRVDLDLPGVAPDDVQIELRDDEIRVYGTFGERPREGTLRHHARRTGEFEYLIALPGEVNPDGVSADLDGGVLTVLAPKAHERQARRIEVHQKQQRVVESTSTPTEEPAQVRTPDDSGERQLKEPDNPAAAAKQMKEGQSRRGSASQRAGSTGTGSTGQVGRTSMR
ncbi:Hsp20/alpha crystallin family protein [Dactylosporangium sp. CA-092794]|uniref:Hsp20/alpha crystallin family protein n=1 Tax=Dactylosporangium sp. CA-092794 TaxID=3239929 RepID=UPI003D92C540